MYRIIIQGQIIEAKPIDLYRPWIRIAKNKRGKFRNKEFVKVKANNKKVYCQIKGLGDDNSENMEISEHYRELLGWNQKPRCKVQIEVTRVNQFFGIFKVLYYHPDDFVRLGVTLGIISVIGLVVSLIGLVITVFISIDISLLRIIVISIVIITLLFVYLSTFFFWRPFKNESD